VLGDGSAGSPGAATAPRRPMGGGPRRPSGRGRGSRALAAEQRHFAGEGAVPLPGRRGERALPAEPPPQQRPQRQRPPSSPTAERAPAGGT